MKRPSNFDYREYQPSTPVSRPSSQRRITRSAAREVNSRNSALMLTPTRTTTNDIDSPLTPPPIYHYGNRRNRRRTLTNSAASGSHIAARPSPPPSQLLGTLVDPRGDALLANILTPSRSPGSARYTRLNSIPTSTSTLSFVNPSSTLDDTSAHSRPIASTLSELGNVDTSPQNTATNTIPILVSEDIDDQVIDKLKSLSESLKRALKNVSSDTFPIFSTPGPSKTPVTAMPLSTPTPTDPWTETIDKLLRIHASMRARVEKLDVELALNKEIDSEREALLQKISTAREGAMFCPIIGCSTDTMYIVAPCGHAFSDDGLHQSFQFAVMEEFRRLRFFYPTITDESLATRPFDRHFLHQLHNRTRTFRPAYRCAYCSKRIVAAPVKAWAFSEFGTTVRKLMKGVNDEAIRTSFDCEFTDYFVFFTHDHRAL